MSSDEDGRRFRKAAARRSMKREAGRPDEAKSGGWTLHVSLADGAGRPVRVPGLANWLACVAARRARGAVTVALVSDGRIRGLNRQYRGIDRVTDVLSFGVTPALPAGRRQRFLGDVVIAMGAAARQARRAGHPVATEYRILALHGLLHLLGHDHERDRGRMARLERTLRRRGGLERGPIERTVTRRTARGVGTKARTC